MSTKKDEARFTIKFDPGNPHHLRAIEILNGVGRCKADKIAEALCSHYSMGAALPRYVKPVQEQTGHEAKQAMIIPMVAETQEDCSIDNFDKDAVLKAMSDAASEFFQ